jgi:predicted phosphodiesterase
MHYAVMSDVHANLEALEAVLADIEQKHITDILFLGDATGYGPNPNECIEILTRRCRILLAGNHDWGVVGLTDITFFNENARRAIEWTRTVIKEKNSEILKMLPVKSSLTNEDMLLVHSTPKEPGEWHYLLTLWDAEINFHYFENRFCSIGHSHQPFIIERVPTGELITYKETACIRDGSRYIINAGSAGQPRDGDPRASYAVIDDGKVEIARVSYDITRVQEKMKRARMPSSLIERLSAGR